MNVKIPTRFYSLDVLRGIAALSVVLWHWQHFFLPLNRRGVQFVFSEQPLFSLLSVFYQYGFFAVQLFFGISGFIFFSLYSTQIYNKTISVRSFWIYRLSRLYPLHLATLLFVAVFQLVYKSIADADFVYSSNDGRHFLLNLIFASSWGFESGYSFNGPIWSVSVEIILYGLFIIFCKMFSRNFLPLFSAIILGYVTYKFNAAIASGVMGFFLGGLVFRLYERIVKLDDPWKLSVWLPAFTFLQWLATIYIAGPMLDYLGQLPLIFHKIVSHWTTLFLFPQTILSLALIETRRGSLGKRWSFIGDISYSSYLLHFPLQLTVALAVEKWSIRQDLFYSPYFMLAFFVMLISLSLVSNRYFEVPMQHFLRLRWHGKGADVAAR
jgi:peptidoglycan/LPS O-acetylase OafA/YrhL